MNPIDLTIAFDCSTGELTGRCDALSNLNAWVEQVVAIGQHRVEVLLAASRPFPAPTLFDGLIPVRRLHVPDGGYYALKNAAAAAARGAIVLFTDVDCRPAASYLETLLEAFRDPAVVCVAGRTAYDGEGLLTRLNSAHSFGELHRDQGTRNGWMPLANNVALRRSASDGVPFGPFTGRVGGDGYLCNSIRRGGGRMLLVPELLVHHEDITYSLRGTLERHLREHLMPVPYGKPGQRFSALWPVVSVLVLRPGLRLKRVLQAGPRVGVRLRHLPFALLVNAGYWLFDVVCVFSVLAVLRLRRHWVRFIHGEETSLIEESPAGS
jgi:hypothetical protein